jgi:hypothetical protein
MQYLLPCECGQKLPVDASQAGLRIRCTCGAQPQVPTLRGLATLERVTAPTGGRRPSSWGPRQAVAFLGLSIFTVAAAAAVALWFTFPKFPEFKYNQADRQAIERYVNGLTVQESLELFDTMRQGMPQVPELPRIADYQAKATVHRRYLLAMAITAGVGVLLMLGSLAIRRT